MNRVGNKNIFSYFLYVYKMTARFRVSDSFLDDKTFARKASVKVGTSGDIKFETPFKIGTGGVTSALLYEVHKRVKPDTIKKCLESEAKDRKHGLELAGRCKGTFNITTLEYDSSRETPTEKMVEELSDMQYNHTDAIPTPSWFDLITRKDHTDVDLYLELSDTFVNAAATRNHKPILGAIPQSIPPTELGRVIKFYIDKDVTSFVVDSHGRTLISGSWVRLLQRSFEEYSIEKECLLYSMNAFQGTIRKNEDSCEAKDFIGFAAGFDIIGGKHSNKFGAKEEGNETIARLFDKETYNYTKVKCKKDDKQTINDRSVRAQIKEMEVVRTTIEDGKTKELLLSKNLLSETLDTLFGLKNKSNRRIEDFI